MKENSYPDSYRDAFGMVMQDGFLTNTGVLNNNLYNGQSEWQNDYGNLPDYYQALNRNYDAVLGRFISVDPMPESAESMTTYQYAGNNPVMMNDPSGNLSAVQWNQILNIYNNGPITSNYYAQDDGTDVVREDVSGNEAFINTAMAINSSNGWAHTAAGNLETYYYNYVGAEAFSNNNIKQGPGNGFGVWLDSGNQLSSSTGGNNDYISIWTTQSNGSTGFVNYQMQNEVWRDGDMPWLQSSSNSGAANQGGTNTNQIGNNGFNIQVAVNYLDAHAYDHYIKGVCGKCAMHVREAIQAGGINTVNHPVPARMYAPFLTKWGFNTISPTNYTPEMGDIRVWQPYLGDSNNYGHIDMYNGNRWVSDFMENNFYPGNGYRNDPNYQIFRWPGQ